MGKRHKGRPLIALRLSPESIEALKICAGRNGQTVSDLIRQMIEERLRQEGISAISKPLDGQLNM